ncbi:MAG: DUF975 family protein [Sediminibacterium sp.]
MVKTNKEILKEAELALNNKWGKSILVNLTYIIIVILIAFVKKYELNFLDTIARDLIQTVISLIITGPFLLGLYKYHLSIARRENPAYETMFDGFKDFKRAFITYLLSSLYILLRLLLLIIPGIIAALNYALVYFILLDDKEITVSKAILKSKKIMYGHRKRLFYLSLRFLGLGVLSIFTLFIGLLWLIPYSYVAYSIFYEDVKRQYEDQKIIIE